jgi:hypothetical protein
MVASEKKPDLEEVKDRIRRGDTRGALGLLAVLVSRGPHAAKVVLLEGQLNQLESELGLGLLDPADADIRRNRINAATLQLVQRLESEDGPGLGPSLLRTRLRWVLPAAILLLAALAWWWSRSRPATSPAAPSRAFRYAAHGVSSTLTRRLDTLQAAGEAVHHVALGGQGEWIALYGRNGYWQYDVPARLVAALDSLRAEDAEFHGVLLASSSDYLVWYDKNGFRYRSRGGEMAPDLPDTLARYAAAGRPVKTVALSPGGFVLLWDYNGYVCRGADNQLLERLRRLNREEVEFHHVAVDRRGNWLLLFGDNHFSWSNIDRSLLDTLQNLTARGARLRQVAINEPEEWVVLYD